MHDMECNLCNEMNAAAVMQPLLKADVKIFFPHIQEKPLFFRFCNLSLSRHTHTHTKKKTHTSWLGVLPQPVICLMNNGAVRHPHWGAESYQPTQINYNRPVIIPDSLETSHMDLDGTHTSGDDRCRLIRSQIHCGLSHRFPEGVAMVTLVDSQPRRFLCGLESGCLVSHSVSLSHCVSACCCHKGELWRFKKRQC